MTLWTMWFTMLSLFRRPLQAFMSALVRRTVRASISLDHARQRTNAVLVMRHLEIACNPCQAADVAFSDLVISVMGKGCLVLLGADQGCNM
jgi:hypothetical protein